MVYIGDPWVWFCFGLGVTLPIAITLTAIELRLDLDPPPTQRRWTVKRILFVCAIVASTYGSAYLTQGYLDQGRYDRYGMSLSVGIFLGGIIAAWQYLRIRHGMVSPLRFASWKSAFIRSLAGEGKSIDDFKSLLARTVIQIIVAMICVSVFLFIIRRGRLFGGQ
jgi:hypothetical protein